MVGKICTAIPLEDSQTRHVFLSSIGKNYSACTLLGNWYNERLRVQEKRYNATIVPTITIKEKCVCDKSSYNDDYTNPKKIKRSDVPTYEEQNIRYKTNVYKGKDSSVLIMDSKDYLTNYTTIKDIKYRLQPPEDNWSKVTDRPVSAPREDLLQSFGNKTNFGLRQWLKNVRNEEKLYRTDDTTYTDAYRHPKLPSKKNMRVC